VYPTYAPVTANPKNTNFKKNHVQLPPPEFFGLLALDPLFLPSPELDGLPPRIYKFWVRTEMMSWLSWSSPVSAEKPR
jgi:hypothetical protein